MYLFINNVLNAKRFSLEHNLEKEKKMNNWMIGRNSKIEDVKNK